MPAYAMPGVAVSQRGSRIVGASAIVVAVLVPLVWSVYPTSDDPSQMAVTLLTERVGEGVHSGTDVRFDGVKVGTVDSIEPAETGRQRIDLSLEKSQLFGLTDALSIDYAPANLFGISEIELRRETGGDELAEKSVVDLTGANADRVDDATISTLLRSLGQFTGDVLTPQLATLLTKVATGTKAFSPLLQSILVTAESIAATQTMPMPVLVGQFGSILQGAPSTIDGALHLLYTLYSNEYMQDPANQKRFDDTFTMLRDHLLPSLNTTLEISKQYFPGHVDMLAPLLEAIGGSVSAPQQSGANLSLLIDRLSSAFHDTPNGPALNVDIDLRGVPALAVPLLGGGR